MGRLSEILAYLRALHLQDPIAAEQLQSEIFGANLFPLMAYAEIEAAKADGGGLGSMDIVLAGFAYAGIASEGIGGGGGGSVTSRPSGFRAGVRDSAFDGAVEPRTGRVRDPGTGRFIGRDSSWDMGHRPGWEFRKHQRSAETRDVDRQQFLDEHNISSHYRPELPSTNRSHKLEGEEDYWRDLYGG
jgi:hypothetical protein